MSEATRPLDEDEGVDGAGGEIALAVSVVNEIGSIDAAEWDNCAAPERADGGPPLNPFVTHAFLHALEVSRSATRRTGWAPHHLVMRLASQPDGPIIGAMPLYLKSHSQGEFVFDHSWAHAYEGAGGDYYPKLQAAVPFTPATGPRLLVNPTIGLDRETVQAGLLDAARRITADNHLSSLHVTFCTDHEWHLGKRAGFLQRTDQQFHWENAGYQRFEDFLDALSSRKRKNLRKERERAVENGIEMHWLTGDALGEEHWDAFWHFYQDTGTRKWGRPYLSRQCFEILGETMADRILLVMARRSGRWIAGALNVIGRETLFGRYWGCTEDHPFLHFETCYYQAIDFAIAHGLKRVEAGAQGGHKLARGYAPTTTRSLHYLPDPGFSSAVEDYLERERRSVDRENAALTEMMPFKKQG
ncbi:MAG: GNAT family N-acetyltransferase [Pseudomonadota bacterium]